MLRSPGYVAEAGIVYHHLSQQPQLIPLSFDVCGRMWTILFSIFMINVSVNLASFSIIFNGPF